MKVRPPSDVIQNCLMKNLPPNYNQNDIDETYLQEIVSYLDELHKLNPTLDWPT